MGEHKRKTSPPQLPPSCAPGRGSRACYFPAGHEGPHHWQYCQAEYECYVIAGHSCELLAGHEGPHRATIEWGGE